MGGSDSRPVEFSPGLEPAGEGDDAPVDSYLVGCEVAFSQTQEDCSCFPLPSVSMDSVDLYTMLAQQYTKGFRMLHFTRMPGDMKRGRTNLNVRAIFQGYFRMNPNLGERYGDPITWRLRTARAWLQTQIQNQGVFSMEMTRVVNINGLVKAIADHTQNGERLVAACVTGHCQAQSAGEFQQSLGAHEAVDMFFEVPCPVPSETYVYNLALLPVRVEFDLSAFIFYPNIQYDWMGTFNYHLQQGWRLIDIHIDIPIIEQLRTPRKVMIQKCKNTTTNAVWIFEKPRSRQEDCTPLYEGTMVEQTVNVRNAKSGYGVESTHDWMPLIRDMGSRGWELACVLECHASQSSYGKITIRSLLFFQRPLTAKTEEP